MGALNQDDGGGGANAAVPSAYYRARGFLGFLEKLAIAIAAIAVLAFGIYITTGIIFRSFLGSQIYDEVVIVGELMVVSLILPLAFVAADRGFIAVEVLTVHFSTKMQPWLNVLTAIVGLFAVTLIMYGGWHAFFDAWIEGSYFFGLLDLPEWPGRLAFAIGYLLFFIRLLDLLIHDLLVSFGIVPDPDAETEPDRAGAVLLAEEKREASG